MVRTSTLVLLASRLRSSLRAVAHLDRVCWCPTTSKEQIRQGYINAISSRPKTAFIFLSCHCSLTDVFAGVALMNEPPEAAIMQETPRDVKKQRLVDIRLIGYSYLFLGNTISIGMRDTEPDCTAPIIRCCLACLLSLMLKSFDAQARS